MQYPRATEQSSPGQRARALGVLSETKPLKASDTIMPRLPDSRSSDDDAVLWTALLRDSSCRVAIVDQTGAIEFTNDAFTSHPSDGRENPPQMLSDLYPPALADERLRILRRSLSTDSGITLVGLVNGRPTHDSFRPLSRRGEGVGRVLLVSSNAGPLNADDADAAEVAPAHEADEQEVIRAVHDDMGELASLTKRELEVLRHIGMGLSTADIAKALHRSVKTVEWHRVSLGNKLGASNRVELARMAIRAGLCPLPS